MIPLRYLVATELRMGVRTRLFRIACLVAVGLGWATGSLEGTGAAMSAYTIGEAACHYLGILATVWSALGAVRDSAQRADVIVYTKPQPPERLAFARYCGLLGPLLLLLAALFLGAMLGRFVTGWSLLGYGAYGLQYLRAAAVVFFASGAAYTLALLGQSMVSGALVGLALVVAIAGRAFLAKVYFPWYGQNQPAFAMLTLFLLCVGLWFGRRRLRGQRPAAATLRWGAAVSLALTVGLFGRLLRTGHDPMSREDPGLLRMATQTVAVDRRTPGFLLPDQKGRPTALSQFPGKILLVALWSPQETDSAQLLATLAAIHREYGGRGVQPVAICLSEDASAPATFAAGEDLPFPVVHDWGTHNAPQAAERSPMALAYLADHLPTLVVTDRRHRVRAKLDGAQTYSRRDLDRLLEIRLAAEPEWQR